MCHVDKWVPLNVLRAGVLAHETGHKLGCITMPRHALHRERNHSGSANLLAVTLDGTVTPGAFMATQGRYTIYLASPPMVMDDLAGQDIH